MIVIEPEPLTRAAFAPFGEVIEMDGAEHFPINQGYAERYHDLAHVDPGEDAEPIISMARAKPRPLPIEIALMERHPLGTQAFYPLRDGDWLVVVADPRETLTPATLRAFRASGRQGVNYSRNVWHHPLLVLAAPSDFLILDRKGPGNNLEEFHFPENQRALVRV